MNILKKLKSFHREEEAATAVEYSVMLMLIIAVCIVAIQSVGDHMAEVWNDNATQIGDVMNN